MIGNTELQAMQQQPFFCGNNIYLYSLCSLFLVLLNFYSVTISLKTIQANCTPQKLTPQPSRFPHINHDVAGKGAQSMVSRCLSYVRHTFVCCQNDVFYESRCCTLRNCLLAIHDPSRRSSFSLFILCCGNAATATGIGPASLN